MIDLKVNERKKFNFQLEISGVQARDLTGSMKIIIDGINYGFPIEMIDGSVVAEIPALEKITKATLTEGQSLPVSLEIIANDTLIIPWKDSFTVRKPVKVEAKMVNIKDILDEINITPKIKITNIKEEKVDKKEEKKLEEKVDIKPIKKHKSKMSRTIFGD